MALPPIKGGNASRRRASQSTNLAGLKLRLLAAVRLPTAWACMAIAQSVFPGIACALEFKTVAVPKAILYDAPSAQGKKLYILGLGYPVEVIVNLGEWVKVRDNQGGLSWIEAKQLGSARGVLVAQGPTDMRQAADASSALLAKLDKDVTLDVIEPTKNGWLKVKHRDGLTGYVQANAVWGW